jgi:hypothetical protein
LLIPGEEFPFVFNGAFLVFPNITNFYSSDSGKIKALRARFFGIAFFWDFKGGPQQKRDTRMSNSETILHITILAFQKEIVVSALVGKLPRPPFVD